MIHPIMGSHPTSDNLCPHIQLFISGVSHFDEDIEEKKTLVMVMVMSYGYSETSERGRVKLSELCELYKVAYIHIA